MKATAGPVARNRERRCLLVGVRGHGGEEVYSTLLRDHMPDLFRCQASFRFHNSCEWGRCGRLHEIALNRLVHPLVPFNMGFRVFDVHPDVDLVHVHTHPSVLKRIGRRPVVFSAGSSHHHYEVVDDGRTGWRVSPERPDELYEAMLTMARDPMMRSRMGEAGRRNFVTRFSIGVFRAALQDVYAEAIDRTDCAA